MASRKHVLVLLISTVAVLLSACTGFDTVGLFRQEPKAPPPKAEAPAQTPVPASPITATTPAPPQVAETEMEVKKEEEKAESSPVTELEPATVPPSGSKEGAPAASTGSGAYPDNVAKGGVPAQPGGPQYVSLNFDNADLELVLRSIADITGINFIIGPGVKANVTMRTTTRVPATEVFSIMESVLEVNNLVAVKEGSYYKIVPIAVAQQEPQDVQVGKERAEERERYMTQIVHLDHLSADEMAKILQSFLAKGAKMLVHKETNSLIIAGFSSTINRLLDTIKALDIPSKRDNIQRIFVYFVENAKAAELANTLNTLYGRRDLVRGAASAGTRPGQPSAKPGTGTPPPAAPTPQPAPGQPAPASSTQGAALPPGAEAAPGEVVGEVTIVSDEATNALIIKTSPRNYEIIEATIKQIDIVPKQVLIELMLARITLSDGFSFSLEEIIRSGQFLVGGQFGGPITQAIAGVVQDPTKKLASGLTFAFVDKDKVRVVLRNLAEVSKAQVLANPHLLTANNKEAAIQIGQEVPIPTGVQTLGTTSSTEGGATSNLFSTFQRKDIGIILKIKPHVNEKRFVTLDIETENTSIAPTGGSPTAASEGGASFNKTTTKTAVVVQDGQSLLIGGIIRTDKSKSYTGIPFLSSIPLLGYLFRGTTESLNRDELLILITPHVVGTPEEGKLMSEQFRSRVESLELLMKSSPTISPSGLAPKSGDQGKGDLGW
ncbi:secretin N-terminal domain-containing protein [Candidatus Methylomirabilis sp.]|uniref:secretin N-terminal domain-containing protein n=1 Tax=Candidatus Methylomirabilis sp. TaxID=2032687 RepID=UPI002A5DF306|nr:secretin N-terminal domain-containing protein [Candidatus Methylomirabilis sp.]